MDMRRVYGVLWYAADWVLTSRLDIPASHPVRSLGQPPRKPKVEPLRNNLHGFGPDTDYPE